MSSSVTTFPLNGCRRMLLLTVALIHTCQLLNVAAECESYSWCRGMFCTYGRIFDSDGCATCDCNRPCEEVSCNAGQRCEILLSPGCDGKQCQKYIGRCRTAETTSCPHVNCTGVICRFGFSNDENGCPTCRCDDPCARRQCPPGQVCKLTSDDCEPGLQCRDGPMPYCADASLTSTAAVATSMSTRRSKISTATSTVITTTSSKPSTTSKTTSTSTSTAQATTTQSAGASTPSTPRTTTPSATNTRTSTIISTSSRPTSSFTVSSTTLKLLRRTRTIRATTTAITIPTSSSSSAVSSSTPSPSTSSTSSPTSISRTTPTLTSTVSTSTTTTSKIVQLSTTMTTVRCPVVTSCPSLVCDIGREINSEGCFACSCVEPCQAMSCPSGQTCKISDDNSTQYCDAENVLLEGVVRINANYSIIDSVTDFRLKMKQQIGSYVNVSSERVIIKKVMEGSIVVYFDIDKQTNTRLEDILSDMQRMSSAGLIIVYVGQTYNARLVNFTIYTAALGRHDGQSHSYNFVLLVVLVCALVPLAISCVILIIVAVVIKKSKGQVAISDSLWEQSVMQNKVHSEIKGAEKHDSIEIGRNDRRISTMETFA